ncbi:MAG: GNAT family N-acetyltransferase [Bacteroidetes bacterium]|nr:GNAT family N-acetyltransferase [Bacteroidota bacterium]MBS1931790.1 GNAT family N-acetyltransferase [Bacteroidota bacterium]
MIIRAVHEKDAEKVSQLSGQLGYPTSLEKTIENIRQINADYNQVTFVAECENTVAGWIQLQKRVSIVSSPFVEIVGLIVDENHRNKKIGKALVKAGIDWAKQKNILQLRVRSNAARNESHGFYKTLGFREVKTQKVYDWGNE